MSRTPESTESTLPMPKAVLESLLEIVVTPVSGVPTEHDVARGARSDLDPLPPPSTALAVKI